MNNRSFWASFGLLVASIAALIAATAHSDGEKAFLDTRWDSRADAWVRTSDTACAAVPETLTGPSLYCFGAAQAIFRVQANSGTCSLITVQMSMNDTNWTNQAADANSGIQARVHPGVAGVFVVGDSLNRGGVFVNIYPRFTSATDVGRAMIIPWRYTRLFITTRTGYTVSTASAGPTVACRTKLDSLRITGYVQRNAP